MKSSPELPGDEQMDALLFDYLEGALSEAEAKKLEERLAIDPALRCELEYWPVREKSFERTGCRSVLSGCKNSGIDGNTQCLAPGA